MCKRIFKNWRRHGVPRNRDSMYLLLDREGANAKMYYFRYEYNTASEKIINIFICNTVD